MTVRYNYNLAIEGGVRGNILSTVIVDTMQTAGSVIETM